ncbi:hypothetical protein K3495_g14171 [Podosphaera aphanis]|nr:hypothetical protein K3495_g14171 [Podosphaera aphanis]
MVKHFFGEVGLNSGQSDPNLFIGLGVYVLLFVDDMLIVGERSKVDNVKNKILTKWKGKDLREAKIFVGFQLERDRNSRTIRVHQNVYTNKLLERMGMLNCNPTELPMPAGTVLKDADEHELLDDDESGLYRQIVGSTIYLCNNTRPDIAYPVGQLARFTSKPGEPHLKMAKQLLLLQF